MWTFKQGFLSMKLIQNPQYDFPKGGSKAVWNISENSSVLVALVFPKYCNFTVYVIG